MTEELMEILKEEYETLIDLPYESVAEHIYFNIIVGEDFIGIEDEFIDSLKEWYSDYEFYENSGEADEEEMKALVDEVLETFKNYVSEE